VALDARGADLGTVSAAPGGSIEVRLLGGPADARAFVRAECLGAPVYVRQAQGTPREPVTLRGLGAGRFRVSCGARAGFGHDTLRSTEEEIELDGSSTLVRVVDLR